MSDDEWWDDGTGDTDAPPVLDTAVVKKAPLVPENELKLLVEKFVAGGGKIEKFLEGQRALKKRLKRFKEEKQIDHGRCAGVQIHKS